MNSVLCDNSVQVKMYLYFQNSLQAHHHKNKKQKKPKPKSSNNRRRCAFSPLLTGTVHGYQLSRQKFLANYPGKGSLQVLVPLSSVRNVPGVQPSPMPSYLDTDHSVDSLPSQGGSAPQIQLPRSTFKSACYREKARSLITRLK